MYLKELRSIIKLLENAHQTARQNTNTPHETVCLFVASVGRETAEQCVAAMVRRASWDGRISREAKNWAEAVQLSEDWVRRVDDAYCDTIHMAHLSQIAETMSRENLNQ